jgi:hypothetical protein
MLVGAASLFLALPSYGRGLGHRPVTESVLTNGMRIVAHTPSGQVVIEGKRGFARKYSGDGWSKTATLTPRTTRWYGSLGLYDPAPSNSLSDRLLLDEGTQFFSTESEALRYLKALSRFFGALTFSKSGLVVAYKVIDISGGRPSRSLEIWQIYIDGSKPTSLRGGDDNSIEISGGSIPSRATPAPARVGFERELAETEYDVGLSP